MLRELKSERIVFFFPNDDWSVLWGNIIFVHIRRKNWFQTARHLRRRKCSRGFYAIFGWLCSRRNEKKPITDVRRFVFVLRQFTHVVRISTILYKYVLFFFTIVRTQLLSTIFVYLLEEISFGQGGRAREVHKGNGGE